MLEKQNVLFYKECEPGSGSQPETHLGPASEAQNQWEEEMLPAGQSRQIGGGLERVFISCTHFADQATVEKLTVSFFISGLLLLCMW